MIDSADLPSDWAIWSVDQPVERLEFYDWLHEMMASPAPAESLLPAESPPIRTEALAGPAAPKRRIRRPSLESTVRQVLKAAQAAGVSIAVTIEGETVTATPTRGIAPAPREDRTPGEQPPDAPSRSLFKARAVPKQKVVL
jgi:hypothetical protein